ncbi:MAG: glutaredoxin family protein [Dehalococcoidia bacterium]|nr:glutaredoxin family protein [Dehalococcoidia bacterium]
MARGIVLYERPGCGLCEEAARMLGPLASELGCTLRRVDIESDPALEARYWLVIPVVALEDGRELARAPIDEAALESRLRTESARGP